MRISGLEDTLERVKAEKSKAMAECQLERERRIRGENRLTPEADFNNELQTRTHELEFELKEKNKEVQNLDRRLNERGEKLAEVTVKMNEASKENIRMKKRLEKINATNKEMNREAAENSGDLEKALDALKTLKTELKTKSELVRKKNDQIAALESDRAELVENIDGIRHNERIQKDSKTDVERRLVVALQDHAIAQMTIKELEEKLSERVVLFEGLREKVEDDAKRENQGAIERCQEDLKIAEARKAQLQGVIESQKLTIGSIEDEKTKLEKELKSFKTSSAVGNKELIEKTSECTRLTSELSALEKKIKDQNKKITNLDSERKSLKKISDALAKKLDKSQQENDDQKVKTLTLERRADSLLDEIKCLKDEIRGKKEELEEEVSKVEGYRAKIGDLELKMQSFDGQIENSTQRIRTLEFDLKCKEKEALDFKEQLTNESNRCDEINANLESTRSKYLASEQKITELKIALQAAELNSEAKVNHDERQKEELLQLRKLNRKLDREISMYKEILTTTSSTEAKNTERLVELRKSINELTEQKLDAETELQKFISENENLKSRVKEMKRENTNIKKTVQVNMEAVQSAELERAKIELSHERQRAISAEKINEILQNRLRKQAAAEAESNTYSKDIIERLENELSQTRSESRSTLRTAGSSRANSARSAKSGSSINDEISRTIEKIDEMAIQNLDENIDGVEDLKKQIQAIKDNLENSTVSESSTLMHEVSQFNVELESFLSEADQSHSDTILIDDFKAKLNEIESRLNALPEDI